MPGGSRPLLTEKKCDGELASLPVAFLLFCSETNVSCTTVGGLFEWP